MADVVWPRCRWFSHFGYLHRGAKQGGLGGLNPSPPKFWNGGGGVEHLSTPPDFEKKNFRGGGGWLPLN